MTCLVAHMLRVSMRALLMTPVMSMMMFTMHMRASRATVLNDNRNILDNGDGKDVLHAGVGGHGRHGALTAAALGTELSGDEGETGGNKNVKVHFRGC